jgi:hypothetical protein
LLQLVTNNKIGLIKFGWVVHGFIDGHSRYVTGIGVHDNNRADTVLELFLRTVDETGLPSRLRGDHGGENMAVAKYMEEQRGPGRSSYIWGRYVPAMNLLLIQLLDPIIEVYTTLGWNDAGMI